MPIFKRRDFLKAVATAPLASQANAFFGLDKNKKKQKNFPKNVKPWHISNTGIFPREGIEPPLNLDFPVRTHLPFAHGVASGDPLPDSVILWTRLTLPYSQAGNYQVEGQWRISRNRKMSDIVADGYFTTDASRDWTVHVDAKGLDSWTTYYYQFAYEGAESCVGRTRTAPSPGQPNESIRLAVCACSSYFSGYMNSYGRIADRKDIDLVVHCGDYIYDFPDTDEPIRIPNGDTNPDTNVDYRRPKNLYEARRRFALYRSDPDLFRAHQQHPFMILWDNHDIATEADLTYEQSYQAFWEWTPSRRVSNDDLYRRHQRFTYGQLADILFMDRHYPKRYSDTERLIEDQKFLGTSQNQWLRDEMMASKDRHADWRIVINQVFLAQLHLINPPSGIDWALKGAFPDYVDGVILNDAQWDGVPQERENFFRFLRHNHINNNIVLTGDMHMNWASDLNEDPNSIINYGPITGRGSVGVEFAPSSVSRGGADETIRGAIGDFLGSNIIAKIGSDIVSHVLKLSNANAKYVEWSQHGYGIVDIDCNRAVFEFWWTPILKSTKEQTLGSQWTCRRNTNHLEPILFPKATERDANTDKNLAYEVDKKLLYELN